MAQNSKPKMVSLAAAKAAAGHKVTANPKMNAKIHKTMMAKKKKK